MNTMNLDPNQNEGQRPISLLLVAFTVAVLGLIISAVGDWFILHRDPFLETPPTITKRDLVRSFTLLALLALTAWLLLRGGLPKLTLDRPGRPPYEKLAIAVVLGLHAVAVGLFMVSPRSYSAICREDHAVEWASAILSFVCCVIVFFAFLNQRTAAPSGRTIKWSLLAMSAVFFLIAMEEISWFQRVFDIETPKGFSSTNQSELNLHNFQTDRTENAYYFGAFLFLVSLPFARLLYPALSRSAYLGTFISKPYVAVIAAVTCGYNYDMWGIALIQFACFGALGILLAFTLAAKQAVDKFVLAAAFMLIAAGQVLYLVNGPTFVREWDVTEYKEFFIPLACLVYAIDLLVHVKQTQTRSTDPQALGTA